MSTQENVTLHDIARIAGVGLGTASRALRNAPGVAPATRDRVLAVAEQLSYVVSPQASSLRLGSTGRIAVVVPHLDRWFFGAMLAGIESVVAPLGTALTEEQASMISRQTKNVFLLYDSDAAGQKATFRAGDLLLSQGVSVRVVTLPDGEDPDTFVDSHGRAALETHIDGAVDVFDRKVQILERQGWFADLHKRRRAIDRLLPTIRATADLVTRDMYIARASEALPRRTRVRRTDGDHGS